MSIHPQSLGNDPLLPHKLEQRLETFAPFPAAAMRRMEPELSYGRHLDPPPANARSAAVAIVLYPRDGQWTLPFVVRPVKMRNHAGQVAFPGGQVDPGETTAEAALRELEEELGVPRFEPKLLGELQPINLFVTNFVVHPWAMLLDAGPEFEPHPGEVARVVEVALADLLDDAAISRFTQNRNGIEVSAPCFHAGDDAIWGATAILLGEFLDAIRTIEAA